MGHMAPSGKLLQYETYGNAPWIALAVNGTIGLVAFLNGTKMAEWTERKFAPLLHNAYEIFGIRQGPSSCRHIFLTAP
ncbi:hypothetical protein D3C87_1796640 [compost metagenome]